MTTTFNPNDYEKALEKDVETLSNLKIKSFDLGRELKIDNVYQRRDYIKHVSIIAIGLLAFAPLIKEKVNVPVFFYVGICLIFIVIVLALMRLREHIDDDAKILAQQPAHEKDIDNLIDLGRNYLSKDFTYENSLKWVKERAAIQNMIVKVNHENTDFLDYFLEALIAIFVIGVSLILGAVFFTHADNLRILTLLFVAIFIFFITFFLTTTNLLYPLNYLLNKIPRKRF